MAGSGTSANGVNTLANIGISSTYQTVYNKLEKITNEHKFTVNYHNLHGTFGTRIPSVTLISQIAHMATILFNNANTIPIPYYSKDHYPIHNPNGIDASILKTVLWDQYMILFASSYNAEKIRWQNIQDLVNMPEYELVESLTFNSAFLRS